MQELTVEANITSRQLAGKFITVAAKVIVTIPEQESVTYDMIFEVAATLQNIHDTKFGEDIKLVDSVLIKGTVLDLNEGDVNTIQRSAEVIVLSQLLQPQAANDD